MFRLTMECAADLYLPAPEVPSRAPADAIVPVVHFFQGSAHQFDVSADDFTQVMPVTPNQRVFSGCRHPKAAGLTVIIEETSTGVETISTITVKLPNGLRLTRSAYPILVCPNVHPHTHLLTAYAWGDDITDPIYHIPRYCNRTRSKTPLTFIDHGDNELIYVYPAAMSMQYMTLYNSNRSNYLACYSTGENTLSFNARIVQGDSLELSVNHYPYQVSGIWRSPECSTAELGGGWHPAARLYASRMRPRMPQAEPSPWLRDHFHGWGQVGMHFEGQTPAYKYNDLPEVFRGFSAEGLRTLHIFGWSGNGHDTLYPDYDIDPALGTKDDLRKALKTIKAMGGRSILYTNCRLVDPNSPFYKNGGSAFTCKQRNGQPYLENYSTSPIFEVACPACAGYRDYFANQVARMVGEFGANAVQLDQINSTIGFLCFDPSHNHPTPSVNFLPGWTELARQVDETGLRLDPDFFAWGEGCQERFGRHIAVHQGHGERRTVTVGEMIPELFKYHYPETIVTGASTGYDELAHCASQGKPLDNWFFTRFTAEFKSLLHHYLALREQYPQYYFNGYFTGSEGLHTSGPFQAFALHNPDRTGMLLSCWAPGALPEQNVEGWLHNPIASRAIHQIYPQKKEIHPAEWINLKWNGALAVFEWK